MKVKIVRTTSTANHGHLPEGKILATSEKGFNEKTFERWIRRGIAVEYVEQKAVAINAATNETGFIPEVVEESKFESMTFQELRKYAKEAGYENYGKMNKEGLVNLVSEEAEDEPIEKDPFFDGVEDEEEF